MSTAPASLRAAFVRELRLGLVALQFLTRVPVPPWVGFDPAWLNRSVRHFPHVGALVGAFGGVVALAADVVWSPGIAAGLAVAATVWLTAAFHEDGLADTFDALLGAAPRERALAIMKDSRIGSYGAAALVLSLLLRVTLLAELLSHGPWIAVAVWVAAHAAGRATAVALMAALPYAGDEADAKAKPLARHVRRGDAVLAVVGGVAWLAVAAMCASPTPAFAAVQVAASATALVALTLALRSWLRRRLAGYTGDTLGAAAQAGEIAVMLVATALVAR